MPTSAVRELLPGVAVPRPHRWAVPFADELKGSVMSEALAAELLAGPLHLLGDDRRLFPAKLPVEGILRNDCRVREFNGGDVILRRGDYGNSAYYILSGGVRIAMSELPDELMVRPEERPGRGVFKLMMDAFTGKRQRGEQRDLSQKFDVRRYRPARIELNDISDFLVQQVVDETGAEPDPSLTDVDPLPGRRVESATPEEGGQIGEIFGDITAMGRSPRSATVVAGPAGVRVLEIRWQGLRDIRKYSPGWRDTLDERYRRFSLKWFLREAELTRGLARTIATKDTADEEESQLDYVAERTQFHSYGEFAWQESFKTAAPGSGSERLEIEPIIVKQGSYPNGVIMIRSGFVRVRHKYNHGEKTVSYLGKGSLIGMGEIYHNWKQRALGAESNSELMTYSHTYSAIGYVDTLSVPVPVVEDVIIPSLREEDVTRLERRVAELQRSGSDGTVGDDRLMEFLVEERAINGSAAMLIDLDRCTRCDDCIRACASTHDNNPRFIRSGPSESGIQLTHACMHCSDPLCLFGCPTGAIHRSDDGDRVVINDFTCIGCSTCADNCPYDNIQMVDIRDASSDIVPGTKFDESRRQRQRLEPAEAPIRKATKCDLCEGSATGPACEFACPHDALIRVNLQQPEPLAQWLDRR